LIDDTVSGARDQVCDLDRLVALVNNLPICSARVQPLFCISLTKRHISEVYDGYDVFERDEGGVRALSVVHVGADLRSTGGAGMSSQRTPKFVGITRLFSGSFLDRRL
jgi:hypothetical protein